MENKPIITWEVGNDEDGVFLTGVCRRTESSTPFGVFTIREGVDADGYLDNNGEEMSRLIFKPQDAPPAIVHEPYCLLESEFGAVSIDSYFKIFAFGWACSQLNIDCTSWDVENNVKCDRKLVRQKIENGN